MRGFRPAVVCSTAVDSYASVMPVRLELSTIKGLNPTYRTLAAGTAVYRQGESCSTCFVVLSGWIAVTTLLDNGACQILDFPNPGALLGCCPSSGAPMDHSAVCLTTTELECYPQQELEREIERNPRLAALLYRIAIADRARAYDQLANIGLRTAHRRIAHLLVQLYARVRGHLPNNPGELLRLPLTHSHLADALGLTCVHVSRSLRALKDKGIAHLTNHTLKIFDPVALLQAAGIETPPAETYRGATGQEMRAYAAVQGESRIQP